MKTAIITIILLFIVDMAFCQINKMDSVIIIQLDTQLVTHEEISYDIDIFNNNINDFQIVFNSIVDDPHGWQHAFIKIEPYYDNEVGFNSTDTTFCNYEIFNLYQTAKNLQIGDSINSQIIFTTETLSIYERETIFTNMCIEHPEFIHYNYLPSYNLITPIKLNSSLTGYLEIDYINEERIELKRIVLGTDIVTIIRLNNQTPENFNIYPNPTNGLINFDYNENYREIESLKIINIQGHNYNAYYNPVPSTVFIKDKGIYIVEIQSNNKIFRKKIIVY